MSHFWKNGLHLKIVAVGKMGRTIKNILQLKNESLLKKWVTLKKCVFVEKMGHT